MANFHFSYCNRLVIITNSHNALLKEVIVIDIVNTTCHVWYTSISIWLLLGINILLFTKKYQVSYSTNELNIFLDLLQLIWHTIGQKSILCVTAQFSLSCWSVARAHVLLCTTPINWPSPRNYITTLTTYTKHSRVSDTANIHVYSSNPWESNHRVGTMGHKNSDLLFLLLGLHVSVSLLHSRCQKFG